MTEVRMARLDEVLSTDRLGQLVMTVGSVAAMEDRAGWDLGQLVRTTSYHEGLGYGGSCTGSCKGYGHARRGALHRPARQCDAGRGTVQPQHH